MRDLVELTDRELSELTAKERLRLVTAASILLVCGLLSLRAVVALWIDPDVPTLPGMDRVAGQIAWAVAFVAMLLVVSQLIRGVLRRRFQWAIGLSLLLHFLLCLSISTVDLSASDRPRPDAGAAEIRKDEWSLPDYAMDDSADAQAVWMQPTITETPENAVSSERMRAQVVQPEKSAVETPREETEISPAAISERQEFVTLAAELTPTIDRNDATFRSVEPIEVPNLETPETVPSQARSTQLESVVMDRIAATLPTAERSELTPAELTPAMTSSELLNSDASMVARVPDAARSEASAVLADVPNEPSRARRDSAIRPASATADLSERQPRLSTRSAPQVEVGERASEPTRRQSELVAQRAASVAPAARSNRSSAAPGRVVLERSEKTESSANRSPMTDGGAVRMNRSGTATSELRSDQAQAENVEVARAESQRRAAPNEASGAAATSRSKATSAKRLGAERSLERQPATASSEPQRPLRAVSPQSASGRSGFTSPRPVVDSAGDAIGTDRRMVKNRGDNSGATSSTVGGVSGDDGSGDDGSVVTAGLNMLIADAGDTASGGVASGGARSANTKSQVPGTARGVSGLLSGPTTTNSGRRQSALPSGGGQIASRSLSGDAPNGDAATGDSSGESKGTSAIAASRSRSLSDGTGSGVSLAGRAGLASYGNREPSARLEDRAGFSTGSGEAGSGEAGSGEAGSGNDSTGSRAGPGSSMSFAKSSGGAEAALDGLSASAMESELDGKLVLAGPKSSGTAGDGFSSDSGRNQGRSSDSGGGLMPGTGSTRAGSGANGSGANGSGANGSGANGGGALAGPRGTSIARRSAGLPGTAGSGFAASGLSDATNINPARFSAARTGGGSDRPSLDPPSVASKEAFEGLIKRSVPVTGSSAVAALPERLSLRTADGRRDAAKTLGGSNESEDAVERGLEWLVRQQHPDGHWSIHDFPGEVDNDPGNFESNSAATGLAMLAFLGAGYTHETGKYQAVVKNGMQWLLAHQKPDGDLFDGTEDFVHFYSHGIAAIAVCEAYGMTKDAWLKQPAQKSINFIVESQNPRQGGWRYKPRFESDTSVSGWQLMALKSAEVAGLNVPADSYAGVARWLKTVERPGGQYSYHPSEKAGLAMTAEGLLMRQYLGAKRDDAQLIAGATLLRTRLPDFGERDAYYWYYATQVMFHMQGDYWQEWNGSLRDMLVTSQEPKGDDRGSWHPRLPVRDKWAAAGGRHYLTCMNLLMLEVYYRHLPLFAELQK